MPEITFPKGSFAAGGKSKGGCWLYAMFMNELIYVGIAGRSGGKWGVATRVLLHIKPPSKKTSSAVRNHFESNRSKNDLDIKMVYRHIEWETGLDVEKHAQYEIHKKFGKEYVGEARKKSGLPKLGTKDQKVLTSFLKEVEKAYNAWIKCNRAK